MSILCGWDEYSMSILQNLKLKVLVIFSISVAFGNSLDE